MLFASPPQALARVQLEPDPISGSSYDGQYGGHSLDGLVAPKGTLPTQQAAYSATDRGAITPLDPTQIKHYVQVPTRRLSVLFPCAAARLLPGHLPTWLPVHVSGCAVG